jgi:chromosome partitioning protein
MPVYEPLERFLRSLSLPFLTRISDSDNYIRAAERGVGVFDMDANATSTERAEFLPVIQWLNSHVAPGAIMHDRKVVDLSEVRRLAAV